MEKQIDLAADHGITTFLFDWYWYGGQKFLHRALEDGFLKARNRSRLKFCIMWANHSWGVFPACREIFRGPGRSLQGRDGPPGRPLADPTARPAAAPYPPSFDTQGLFYDKPLLEIRHTFSDLERALMPLFPYKMAGLPWGKIRRHRPPCFACLVSRTRQGVATCRTDNLYIQHLSSEQSCRASPV